MARLAPKGYNGGAIQDEVLPGPEQRREAGTFLVKNPEANKKKSARRPPDDTAAMDLTPMLDAWEYSESKNIRRIQGGDGRELIQVRLPLGIEQYEINGRPDGKRPMHHRSWLQFYSRKARAIATDLPADEHRSFLNERDFARLHHEGLLFYYRYLLFFQMQEYRLCARDTHRNLKLLDFVSRYAKPELAEQLEQYRPYILRMYVMAQALLQIQDDGNVRAALRRLQDGNRKIDALESIPGNQIFEWEKARALASLQDLIGQLEAQMPATRREQLQKQLESAIREENYEQAATIRDQIQNLNESRRQRKSKNL